MKLSVQALLARPRFFPADITLQYIAARFTERTAMTGLSRSRMMLFPRLHLTKGEGLTCRIHRVHCHEGRKRRTEAIASA